MTESKTTEDFKLTGKLAPAEMQAIDKLIDLAGSIARFKTKEMELVFAEMMAAASTPRFLATLEKFL